MNRSMMVGALMGGAAVIGGLATASYQVLTKPPAPTYAEVLQVKPVSETVETPVERCRQVAVTHRRPVQDEHRIAGTVVGGVLGGVIGHQIGNGRGQDVATVAGAVAGGYAGNRIQQQMQNNDTYTTHGTRCRTVTQTSSRVVGYDVRYLLDGQTKTVRMSQRPTGDRLPVKDGRVVLTGAAPA